MGEVVFRKSIRADVPEIVRLLADDFLGKQREDFSDPLPASYYVAFEQIDSDPNHELLTAEMDGKVIGTLHLFFTPSLSYRGRLRAHIESVRVDERLRSQGIGRRMVEFAIQRAKERGAHIVELTSNNERVDAHRFYQRLGFTISHVGMKLKIEK